MQQANDIGAKIDEQNKEKFIMLFLTCILFFLPFVGEALGTVAVLAGVARLLTIIGDVGSVGLDVYQMVESKGTDPFAIVGILFAPLALFDAAAIAAAAALRRGMKETQLKALGDDAKLTLDKIDRIKGRKSGSSCAKKRSLVAMEMPWEDSLAMSSLNAPPLHKTRKATLFLNATTLNTIANLAPPPRTCYRGKMAAQIDHFPNFPTLPTEIREQIWLLSIPEDEAEVCLPWPGNVRGYERFWPWRAQDPLCSLPCQPLTVDVAFPVAMHACREARDIIRDTKRSGVRFRASRVAGCPTPFRRYDAELDVLYIDHDSSWLINLPNRVDYNFRDVDRESQQWKAYQMLLGTLLRSRRFAMPATLIAGLEGIIDFFLDQISMQTSPPRQVAFKLCYVVPTRDIMQVEEKDRHAAFRTPGRRCRLTPIDEPDWESVQAQMADTDMSWIQRDKPRTLHAVVLESAAKLRDNGVDMGELPELMDTVKVTAATFEEYRAAGTWEESCARRMYHSTRFLCRPDVPLEERPDPELERVHDADIKFQPVPVVRNLLVHCILFSPRL